MTPENKNNLKHSVAVDLLRVVMFLFVLESLWNIGE